MEFRQSCAENDQGRSTWQCNGRSEDSLKPCLAGCISDLMTQGQVVTDQLIGSHPQDLMHVRISEVKCSEIVNVHGTNTPAYFEGVDPFVDEVPEQLGPCSLFLTRCIPDARSGPFVIPTVRRGGIGNPDQGPSGGALVPESSSDLTTRARTHRLEQIVKRRSPQ